MANDQAPHFATKIESPYCGYLNSFKILRQDSYMQSGEEIKPGPRQLQASLMVGESLRRAGIDDRAPEYFKNTSRHAHEMMTRNRNDKTIFANAQKILEACLEQARLLKKTDRVKT